MNIHAVFDEATSTLTYVVYDEVTKDAVIVDPVLDYDPAGSKTSHDSLDKVARVVAKLGLRVRLLLETHAHADHMSGAHDLRRTYFPGTPIGIRKRITEVQETFKTIYHLPAGFKTDGSQFDRLFADGEDFSAGSLKFKAIHTPGHTPACSSYLIENALFVGDALFMPDYGTGRCDFPAGSAVDLYHSITERIYGLPNDTRIFVGHDYQPNGRELQFESTVGEEKQANIQLKATTTAEEFVKFRTERDAGLAAPRLLFPSIQVNIAAGEMPAPEENGARYLKVPLNLFKGNP